MSESVLPRSFYERDVLEVAPDLLGKVLRYGALSGRIVEVEAYRGSDDPASHAFGGMTPRNATMFGPAGHLYTYFTYGMHWCANVVCGPQGTPGAVLLRAARPLDGIDVMFTRRAAARRETDLCSGPAKLCQAFGLGADHDGADLTVAPTMAADAGPDPTDVATGVRIGITRGTDLPWRYWIRGDPHVSGFRG